MLTTSENVLILLGVILASTLLVVGLNRLWPWEKRHAHNDLIGWQLGILGTTYAVILGFMLYTVWTNFVAADANADYEANALRNLYRLSEGLPAEQRGRMLSLARTYADAVLNEDWPEMSRGRIPEASHLINEQMWTVMISLHGGTPTELVAEDHALSELSSLTEHRRLRLLEDISRLPPVLWSVLLTGGFLTVVSAAMFGSKNVILHGFQVFSLSLLLALVLIAIADIDRPFQGSVHVSDIAFRRAQINMGRP